MMKRRLLALCEHHKSLVALATAQQLVEAHPQPVNPNISLHQEIAGYAYTV